MKRPSNLLFIPMDLMIYLKSVVDKISSIVSTIDMDKSVSSLNCTVFIQVELRILFTIINNVLNTYNTCLSKRIYL